MGLEKKNIYIKKWLDYSSKYGIGYLLSNKSIGVFYNDTTKLILDKKGEYFEYMERKKNERIDEIKFKGLLCKYPDKLKKKIRIL